jgi:hypothetical protein
MNSNKPATLSMPIAIIVDRTSTARRIAVITFFIDAVVPQGFK